VSSTRIREAIEKAAKVIADHPEKARVKNAPATATVEDGLRCRVTGLAGELLHTDMPPGMGGGGTAPNPGWLMRAALASCNATGIATRAARAGIHLTKLEVSVSSETDSRGVLGLDENVSAAMKPLQMHVKISAPGTPAEDLRELVNWVCSHSPVGTTDPSTASVDIQVE
jgi:uncharacterized OsmC-like protein